MRCILKYARVRARVVAANFQRHTRGGHRPCDEPQQRGALSGRHRRRRAGRVAIHRGSGPGYAERSWPLIRSRIKEQVR